MYKHFYIMAQILTMFTHIFLFPVQCDGTDLTSKVQDMKLQCLLFLNIPR